MKIITSDEEEDNKEELQAEEPKNPIEELESKYSLHKPEHLCGESSEYIPELNTESIQPPESKEYFKVGTTFFEIVIGSSQINAKELSKIAIEIYKKNLPISQNKLNHYSG